MAGSLYMDTNSGEKGSLPSSERLPISADTPQQSMPTQLYTHLKSEISLQHADIPIIACCLVSGLCDSSSYNAWTYFVSMQTGNTIFLALGVSGQPITHPHGWLISLISILCFLFGCYFFSLTRYINPKRRGTLASSFFIQGCCLITAAAFVQSGIVPEPVGTEIKSTAVGYIELLPLGFLAFQSGGQIVVSRQLGFVEIPTSVLTIVYCDLASDPRFFFKKNVKRNRRLAAVISIFIGGIVGGWLSRSQAGMSSAIWLAAAIKMIIAFSWGVWRQV